MPPAADHTVERASDRKLPVAGTGTVAIPFAIVAAAAAAESLILYATYSGRIGLHLFLTGHAGLVGLLAGWVHWTSRSGGNTALPLLTAIVIAATGPIGAIAALVMIAVSARAHDNSRLLDDWYERIANAVEADEVTRLCEQVSTGRTSALTGTAPASFAAVMERGTLDDRQATLGIIARSFHADYLPALMLALKSPEPVIRVQAAAVATRVRSDLRALVDKFAGASESVQTRSGAALTAASQLDAAIASGLLDAGDQIRAAVVSARLKASASVPQSEPQACRGPILDRQATEAMQLREGRYTELRVGRRIAAVETARLYRVRRPRRPPIAEAP
jgi:hypothetical protein